MDGREVMALPGTAAYYMQRGMSVSGSGTQTGIHGPPGFRPLPNQNMPVQSNLGGNSLGSSFQLDSSSPISAHGAGMSQGEPARRKRGRPRKYGPEGSVSLALSPVSSPPLSTGSQTQKRGRGRPLGSGRKQQLASLGDWLSSSAGMGFTPHIITVAVGEDIATKIMAFSQQGPRAVCILSANGVVSTVTLRQPSTSGGTVTYEGRFEILCLSGSYMLTDNDGSCSRTGGLCVSLSSPDGRVIGGGVGGMLVAATPVQVIVGSFVHSGSKTKNTAGTVSDSGLESELPSGDKPATPTSIPPPNQNLSGWPSSRSLDMRGPLHFDIDLTRG